MDLFRSFSTLPPEIGTFLIAMLPVGELRVSIPFAFKFYHSMSPLAIFLWSILGNMFPVIFILIGLEKVSSFLRTKSKLADKFFIWLFARTQKKMKDSYEKWGCLALAIFVAIPLPMTGAWTGAIAAYIFGINKFKAFWSVFLGVIGAGIIVMILTEGIRFIF